MILDIIESYEKQIRIVNDILESSQDLIDSYRQHRKATSKRVRDSLARSQSLRKKDFDRMMTHVHSNHNRREEEIKIMLRNYIDQNLDLASRIRRLLQNVNSDSSHNENEVEKLMNLRTQLEAIKKEQRKNEQEIRQLLQTYREEQEDFFEQMNGLLQKKRDIRLQELKHAVYHLSQENIENEIQPTTMN